MAAYLSAASSGLGCTTGAGRFAGTGVLVGTDVGRGSEVGLGDGAIAANGAAVGAAVAVAVGAGGGRGVGESGATAGSDALHRHPAATSAVARIATVANARRLRLEMALISPGRRHRHPTAGAPIRIPV